MDGILHGSLVINSRSMFFVDNIPSGQGTPPGSYSISNIVMRPMNKYVVSGFGIKLNERHVS